MAVNVQCFQCNALLSLDDGFRGGVCRCSSCGTLLQVPRGEETPAARKPRPATPPSPVVPTAPAQNATSSKLDVGLSRGQFEVPQSPQMRRSDLGLSSGLAASRVHPTTPIAAPVKAKRRQKPVTPAVPAEVPEAVPVATASPPAGKRSRTLFWLGILLAIVILVVIASFVVYYVWFYETPIAPGLRGG